MPLDVTDIIYGLPVMYKYEVDFAICFYIAYLYVLLLILNYV